MYGISRWIWRVIDVNKSRGGVVASFGSEARSPQAYASFMTRAWAENCSPRLGWC
jgi:hypothetical protein